MSRNETVSRDPGLRDPYVGVKLVPYLRQIADRRSYIWYESLNEIRRRKVTTLLGNLWHLLNPALSISVYFLIFGLLLKVTRGVDNFLLFLTVGIFIFQFSQRATIAGATAIVGNKGLIKALRFPRAMLPITSTLTELLASLPAFALMFTVVLLGGESVKWTWLLFPVMVAVQSCFSLGSAFIAARLTTHFRDMTQILPFIFRLLFYGSGVIYNIDAYTEDNDFLTLMFTFNPLYCFLQFGRWSILGGSLRTGVVISGIVWSVAILIVGFFWFKADEERYARD